MAFKYLFIFLFIFSAMGCSTAQQPSALGNLQIKVSRLERGMEDKEEQIANLKMDIENLTSQIDELKTKQEAKNQIKIPTRPRLKATRNKITEAAMRTSPASVSMNDIERLIRVDVPVKQIQAALKNAGYYDGNIDGKIGSQSKKAIRDFQKDHELVSDGIIGNKTWEQLKNYID